MLAHFTNLMGQELFINSLDFTSQVDPCEPCLVLPFEFESLLTPLRLGLREEVDLLLLEASFTGPSGLTIPNVQVHAF